MGKVKNSAIYGDVQEATDSGNSPDKHFHKPITTGTCDFCGQSKTVDPCVTQEEADELASNQCKCDEGQQQGNRSTAMSEARATINEYFEDDVPDEDLQAHLYKTAELVYNEVLPQATFIIRRGSSGVSVTISRTDKGKFTIRLKENSTREKVIGE